MSSFEFLSTPSARRATQNLFDLDRDGVISIHALREEGDIHKRHPRRSLSISIHALREEGDGGRCGCIRLILTFLSTPSARRATPMRPSVPMP